MDEKRSRAEVLVPRGKAWWTLLALSADFPQTIPELRFVREASGVARALYVDAALISSLPKQLQADTQVTVILWDGYQSYLEYKDVISELKTHVRSLRIRAVGDPSEWDKYSCDSESCGLFFPQCEQLYSREMLRRGPLFSFSDPFLKAQTHHRTLPSYRAAHSP